MAQPPWIRDAAVILSKRRVQKKPSLVARHFWEKPSYYEMDLFVNDVLFILNTIIKVFILNVLKDILKPDGFDINWFISLNFINVT